jgi:hypothetical protein
MPEHFLLLVRPLSDIIVRESRRLDRENGMRTGKIVRTTLLVVVGLSGLTHASPLYKLTDLGHLPGSVSNSAAYVINASGQVAGDSISDLGNQTFLWSPTSPNATTGSMVAVRTGHAESLGINDYGQVVGATLSVTPSAFHWRPSVPNGTSGTLVSGGIAGSGG